MQTRLGNISFELKSMLMSIFKQYIFLNLLPYAHFEMWLYVLMGLKQKYRKIYYLYCFIYVKV